MLTQLAALGIGLITAVGAPAIAHADCNSTQSSSYPSYGAPSSGAPHHPHHAAPTYAPAPAPAPRSETPRGMLRRADYNNDGGISVREAQAYGHAQFRRADVDRNGVLSRREIDYRDDLVRGARGRDGVVTFAEYDASVRRQFTALDRNRNGFLSRYELGRSPAPSNTATYSWRWAL